MSYAENKKRLPRIKDDYHNKQCIIKAINDHFAVSAALLDVSEEKYIGYYQELLDLKYISKVGNKYTPEDFNVTTLGYQVLKRSLKLSASVSINLGLFTLKLDASNK